MRYAARMVPASSFVLMVSLSFGVSPASAQGPSLGGYGAMAGGSGSSMGGGYNIVDTGMGGNVVVPAGGVWRASMSLSMSGDGLSFRARPAAGMETTRLSFTQNSMGGMNRTAGGMGGRRSFTLQPGNLTGQAPRLAPLSDPQEFQDLVNDLGFPLEPLRQVSCREFGLSVLLCLHPYLFASYKGRCLALSIGRGRGATRKFPEPPSVDFGELSRAIIW